jgi:hypothetical protein
MARVQRVSVGVRRNARRIASQLARGDGTTGILSELEQASKTS